jgi:hypothetical protein
MERTMRGRATDSEYAQIHRQSDTIGRMVDAGKRDPKLVSKAYQDIIERREDGRLDLVADTQIIELGQLGIDYDTPLDELAKDINKYNAYIEHFAAFPEPMYHQEGRLVLANLVLVNYKFNEFRDELSATYDDIRRMHQEAGYVPVGIRELLACYQSKKDVLDRLTAVSYVRVLTLGVGIVTGPGRIGEVHCYFEQVPMLRKMGSNAEFDLTTTHVTHGYASKDDYFLARKFPSRLHSDF